jgi:hypothetical protein
MEPHASLSKRSSGTDQVLRDDPVFDNLLLVVDVVDELVQSVDALFEPLFNPLPFLCLYDARDDIEGEDFFCGCVVSVNIESDAALEQSALGSLLAAQKLSFRKRFDFLLEQSGARAGTSIAEKHLIIEIACIVGIKFHTFAGDRFAQPEALQAPRHPHSP